MNDLSRNHALGIMIATKNQDHPVDRPSVSFVLPVVNVMGPGSGWRYFRLESFSVR